MTADAGPVRLMAPPGLAPLPRFTIAEFAEAMFAAYRHHAIERERERLEAIHDASMRAARNRLDLRHRGEERDWAQRIQKFTGRPIGEPCPPGCKNKRIHFHVVERLTHHEDAVL